MRYCCPYAVNLRPHDFLLCKKEMKDGVNYKETGNAISVICLYQKYCRDLGKRINSEDARDCKVAKREGKGN